MVFTRSDLIDAVLRRLGARPGRVPSTVFPNSPSQKPFLQEEVGSHLKPLSGRRFLTEDVIKKTLTDGARNLTIAEDAIVSPLAQDWLALKGIRIIRSDRS